ncbi:hypothetical protein [Nocardioides lijunqiniae]|uniref:hypothetical protein n=1 Tax=Nocardioides lijunqiniae TaxID=2760832 RepID=UPI001878EB9F|nr:hypothetical protein [Nocardioides lijunqiniae]
MRVAVLTAGLAMLAGGLVAPAEAAEATRAVTQDDRSASAFSSPRLRAAPASRVPLDARVGNLTVRPDGPLGSGARRLTSASVRQDLLRDRVSATVVLDAEPTGIGTESYLTVAFGHVADSTCYGDLQLTTITWGTMAAGFSRAGRTITMSIADDQAGYETWDCAFAVLDLDTNLPPDDNTVRSVLLGGLVDVPARPQLSLGAPEVLDRPVRRLPLVRGNWTAVTVPVVNRGRVDATGVRVTGAGRGLRVRGARIERVYETGSSSARIQVRRTSARTGPLRLTVTSVDAPSARRAVRTRPVRAAARPAPGKYANRSGTITFRVTSGRRLTGFRSYTRTQCGGYPDGFPTYTMNTYSFPRSRIGLDGVVDRTQRARLYGVTLQVKIAGRRATSGRFTYSGPDRCFAVDTFTARRVGR